MTTYIVSKSRRAFLDQYFFQWSFGKPDGFLPSKEAFSSITHPAELHYIACVYNWDDGPEVLLWILDSPLCSRSTANLLFWRSLPSYFEERDFSDPSTCRNYCEPGFAIVKRVLERYRDEDFSATDLEFDPEGELEPLRRENPFWKVPDGVFDRIHGCELDVEDKAQANRFLRTPVLP